MASVVGSFIAIKFIELYTKPFKNWPAFKLGLIDEKGKKIRDAINDKEKAQFVSWKNLIRKLKIVLNSVPLGQFGNKLATFASAFWLLKEDFDDKGYNGVNVINTIKEELFSSVKFPINESLSFGKYTSKTVKPSLFIINENTKKLGTMFNIDIYEIKDIITGELIQVASNELRKI